MKRNTVGRFDNRKPLAFQTAKKVITGILLGIELIFCFTFVLTVWGIHYDTIPFIVCQNLFCLISIHSLIRCSQNKPFVMLNQFALKAFVYILLNYVMIFSIDIRQVAWGHSSDTLFQELLLSSFLFYILFFVSTWLGVRFLYRHIRKRDRNNLSQFYGAFYVNIDDLNQYWIAAAEEYCRLHQKKVTELSDSEKSQIDFDATLPMSYMVTWLLSRIPDTPIIDGQSFDNLKKHKLIPQYLLNHLGEILVVNPNAVPNDLRAFSQSYYNSENGYMKDYRKAVDNLYCDEFSWDTYEKLAKILNTRWSEFEVNQLSEKTE